MSKSIGERIVGFSKWEISKKVLAGIVIALFVISLIPIVVTMFFSVPIWDDYAFGLRAHQSYVNGDGFWNGVFSSCSFFYNNWQGFFSTNFIASSQLYTIDENLYFVSNLLFFSILVASLFYFAKVTLIEVVGATKTEYILVSVPIIGYIIQLLPSAAEGIYWMDGSLAMLVTGFVLLLISLIIKYNYLTNKVKKVICFVFIILLSIICSGAIIMDYVTLFLLFLISLVYCIIKRKIEITVIISSFAVVTIGVIISLIAPGNEVRADKLTGFSLLESIKKAIHSSLVYFGKWYGIAFVAVLLFVSVILWNTLKKSQYAFKNPLFVFVLCYMIYSSRMSVQYYAGGYLGAPRQMNQYFLGFIICMSVAWIYFVGWLSKKEVLSNIQFNKTRVNLVSVVIFGCLIVLGSFEYDFFSLNSVSTTVSFIKGQTQEYNREMKERIVLYKNPEIKNVTVKALSYYPSFFGKPLAEGSDDWTNQCLAKYYNKDSVILIK